jgi:acyl-coenzyme A thioesterase PaaI-like protein
VGRRCASLPPTSGDLVARCTASPYESPYEPGRPQHASGTVHDGSGRAVAQLSGWFLTTPTDPAAAERVGLVQEPPAAHLLDLLGVAAGPVPQPTFALAARDALSNALGTLHGAVGALACSLAADAALPGTRPLSSTFAYLRPTPREGTVTVSAQVVRRGRRTGAADVAVHDAEGRLLVSAHVVSLVTDPTP